MWLFKNQSDGQVEAAREFGRVHPFLAFELHLAQEQSADFRRDENAVAIHAKHLDELVARVEGEKISFDGWATPGANVASAALDLARTICRRAERLVAKLAAANEVDLLVIRYLNRLSDLLWLFARYTEASK